MVKRCLLACLMVLLGTGHNAFAQRGINVDEFGHSDGDHRYGTRELTINCLNDNFTVSNDQTVRFDLNNCGEVDTRFWKVKSMKITATGVRWGARALVIVHGVTKGTIYTPGSDSSNSVVTIEDFTNSIEFKGTLGKLRISDIKLVMEANDGLLSAREIPYRRGRSIDLQPIYEDSHLFGHSRRNYASELAMRAHKLALYLRGFSTHNETGKYLLPIITSARWAYTVAEVNGPLSQKVRNSLINLHGHIAFAGPFISDNFQKDRLWEAASDLTQIALEIERALH